MANKLIEYKQKRHAIKQELLALNERAFAGNRDFTQAEKRNWESLSAEAERLSSDIDRMEMLDGDPRPMMHGSMDVRAMSGPTSTRGGYYSRQSANTEDREITDIFFRAIRTGDPGMESELRAYNNVDMVVGAEAEGGYLVPSPVVNRIRARRDEAMLAPLLGVEKVEGVGTTLTYPVDDEADVLFAAVNEASSIDQDSPNLGSATLTLSKYAKYTTLSWELIRDEAAALENFLMGWLARGWSATHNNLLVTAALAGGTASVTADAAAAIGPAEIPELVGTLAAHYRQGAKWLLSSTTFSYLQGLSSANPFLFAPVPGADPMGKLWGYPLYESVDMPDYAASAKSLLFGNFSYGMAYRDPEQLVIIRDPYSAAATGQVKIHAHFSACYAVTIAESLRYLTHPSA